MHSNHNGSAKVALLGIAESRAAWGVLMEAGKATADGVPAQAVRMLDELARNMRTRFPAPRSSSGPGLMKQECRTDPGGTPQATVVVQGFTEETSKHRPSVARKRDVPLFMDHKRKRGTTPFVGTPPTQSERSLRGAHGIRLAANCETVGQFDGVPGR